MPIWLILGIGAGVVVGGFALSKIIPAIIRSIQYRNRMSKEQYEKNLARIKEQSKEREKKKEARKAKKEERRIEKEAKKEARKAKRQVIKKAIIKKSIDGLRLAKGYIVFCAVFGKDVAVATYNASKKVYSFTKEEVESARYMISEYGLKEAIKRNAIYIKDTPGYLAGIAAENAKDLAQKAGKKAGELKDKALEATGKALIAGIEKAEPVILKGAEVVGNALDKTISAGKAVGDTVVTTGKVIAKGGVLVAEGVTTAGHAIKDGTVSAGKAVVHGAKTVKNKTIETSKNIANAGIEKTVGIAAAGIAAGAGAIYGIAEKKKMVAEKEELADSLKSKSHLNKKDKDALVKAEQDLIQHQVESPTFDEPEYQTEPMTLASPNPVYDLSQIEEKVDEIAALEQKPKLTRAEAKQLKKLKKETASFFRHNKDYEMALLNKKIQGKNYTQDFQPVPPPTPNNDKTRQL